jgi:hypothetical protein
MESPSRGEQHTVLVLNKPLDLLCVMDVTVVKHEDTARARVGVCAWHLENVSINLRRRIAVYAPLAHAGTPQSALT